MRDPGENALLQELSVPELISLTHESLGDGDIEQAAEAICFARQLDSRSVEVLEASSRVHRRAGRFPDAMRDIINAREYAMLREADKKAEVGNLSEPNFDEFKKLQEDESLNEPPSRNPRQIKLWFEILKGNRFFKSLHERHASSKGLRAAEDDIAAGPLKEVAKCIRAIAFDAEETIFKEGDNGDTFYVIFHGDVAIVKTVETKHENGDTTRGLVMQVLKTLNAGDSFGDFALDAPDSTSQKRSADARTKSPCILLTLAKTDYRRVTQQLKVLEYAERARWLRQCGAFDSFSEDVLENIARRVTVKLFDAKSIILKQDDDIPEFCIVKSGVIEIFKYVPEGECCRRTLKVGAARDRFPAQSPTKLAPIDFRQQNVSTPTAEIRLHLSADDVYRPEAPGNWVLQRNWKDVENNRVYLGPSRQKRQLVVGVLGRGQVFGELSGQCCLCELAVLDPRPRSPVTALSLSTVALYTLNKQAIADLELKFHLPFVSFLNRSLTLHNPPYHKLAEYYRKWESWKSAKDRVLSKVMSETWMQARRQVMANLLKADRTPAHVGSSRGQCRHPNDGIMDISTVPIGPLSPSSHGRHNSTFRSATTSKMAQHLLAALPKKPTGGDSPERTNTHQLAPRHDDSPANRRRPHRRLEPLASRASRENIAAERYNFPLSTIKKKEC